MAAYTDADVQRLMDAIGIGPKTANAILDAVAPAIVARAQAEALRELTDRLNDADQALLSMAHQTERIDGKGQGVRLARSYADEMVRQIERLAP